MVLTDTQLHVLTSGKKGALALSRARGVVCFVCALPIENPTPLSPKRTNKHYT